MTSITLTGGLRNGTHCTFCQWVWPTKSVHGTVPATITADHTPHATGALETLRGDALLLWGIQTLHDLIGRIGTGRRPGDGVGIQHDVDARSFGDVRENRRELGANLRVQSQLRVLKVRLCLDCQLLKLGASSSFLLRHAIAVCRWCVSLDELSNQILELLLLCLQF